MRSVLVTVPVYNEERFIWTTTRNLAARFQSAGLKFKIAIAEDGSTDSTPKILRRLQIEYPDLLVQSSPIKLGRGLALRRLWSATCADVYLFVDADLPTSLDAVLRVLQEIENGADVAIGSRYCQGAVVTRPPLRSIISRTYNQLVRMMFQDGIRDHQCGLKAFTCDALQMIIQASRENTWAWDTEALVLATVFGLKIVEVPVKWTEYRLRRILGG